MISSLADLLEWLLCRATWISRLGIWAGGLLMMAAVVMIAVEILMRRTLGWTFRGAHELSSYVLAISAAWSFAFALLEKAHIRVDVLYVRLKPRLRALLDLLAMTLMGLFLLILVQQAFGVLSTSIARSSTANTPLATPLWIPQVLWWSGLAWFAIVTLLLWLRILVALLASDFGRIQELAGSRTLEEEISEYQESEA